MVLICRCTKHHTLSLPWTMKGGGGRRGKTLHIKTTERRVLYSRSSKQLSFIFLFSLSLSLITCVFPLSFLLYFIHSIFLLRLCLVVPSIPFSFSLIFWLSRILLVMPVFSSISIFLNCIFSFICLDFFSSRLLFMSLPTSGNMLTVIGPKGEKKVYPNIFYLRCV